MKSINPAGSGPILSYPMVAFYPISSIPIPPISKIKAVQGKDDIGIG